MRTGRFLLIYGVALVVIAVLTILPLLSMMTATLLAGANDCPLNEGNPHPCPILGSDWGETLYNRSCPRTWCSLDDHGSSQRAG